MYFRGYRKDNVSGTMTEEARMLTIAAHRLKATAWNITPFKKYAEYQRSLHNKKVRELTEFRKMFLK